MLHDTHAHLEMLLDKLDLLSIPDERKHSPYSRDTNFWGDFVLNSEAINILKELIINHEFLLHPTVSTFNFQHVSKIFGDFDKVKFFLGSHPEIVNQNFNIDEYITDQRKYIHNLLGLDSSHDLKSQNLSQLLETLRIVGIGEVGLDYFYTKDEDLISTQKQLFRTQIELAIELNLPLMIHCRDAFDDLISILQQYPEIHNQFLIHCFTGNERDLNNILKLGGKVAFGGIVTFGSAVDLHNAVQKCPVENFVLETDLPFLSPKRGQVCLPEHIDIIAGRIADLKILSKEQVWEYSRINTINFLGK